MTEKDHSAQEAKLVEAYRAIRGRDPWLADRVVETILDVAGTSVEGDDVRPAESVALTAE
ncbi:hypothetical protein ACW73L_04715 [Methylolobus aquaticus]